jgi:hypothetical protein
MNFSLVRSERYRSDKNSSPAGAVGRSSELPQAFLFWLPVVSLQAKKTRYPL